MGATVAIELIHALAEGGVLRVEVGEDVAEGGDDLRHEQARRDDEDGEDELL